MRPIPVVLIFTVLWVAVADRPTVADQIGKEVPTVKKVLAADEARRQAMLHGDVRALDSLLGNDVTIVWGDGTTDNKAS